MREDILLEYLRYLVGSNVIIEHYGKWFKA
jgi:hypothetical protein